MADKKHPPGFPAAYRWFFPSVVGGPFDPVPDGFGESMTYFQQLLWLATHRGEGGSVMDVTAEASITPGHSDNPTVSVTREELPGETRFRFAFAGVQGAPGEDGTTGAKGDPGQTPEVSATASVTPESGEPGVTVTRSGPSTAPVFDFAFRGLKGEPGIQGEQGRQGEIGATPEITLQATVDDTSGEPSATVVKSGTEERPVFAINFTGLKGDTGKQGAPGPAGPTPDATATVDNTIGDPKVTVSVLTDLDGHKTYKFSFTGLKGEKGETGAQGPTGSGGVPPVSSTTSGYVLTVMESGGIRYSDWAEPADPFPAAGNVGDVLTKTADGQQWQAPSGGSSLPAAPSSPSTLVHDGDRVKWGSPTIPVPAQLAHSYSDMPEIPVLPSSAEGKVLRVYGSEEASPISGYVFKAEWGDVIPGETNPANVGKVPKLKTAGSFDAFSGDAVPPAYDWVAPGGGAGLEVPKPTESDKVLVSVYDGTARWADPVVPEPQPPSYPAPASGSTPVFTGETGSPVSWRVPIDGLDAAVNVGKVPKLTRAAGVGVSPSFEWVEPGGASGGGGDTFEWHHFSVPGGASRGHFFLTEAGEPDYDKNAALINAALGIVCLYEVNTDGLGTRCQSPLLIPTLTELIAAPRTKGMRRFIPLASMTGTSFQSTYAVFILKAADYSWAAENYSPYRISVLTKNFAG